MSSYDPPLEADETTLLSLLLCPVQCGVGPEEGGGGAWLVGVVTLVVLCQRRYDKAHVMPHAYINERVLHTFLP